MCSLCTVARSRNNSVDIATDYGLDVRGSISGKDINLSLLHSVYTVPGSHPACSPMGASGSFGGDKAADALS
jgi:hypothetical protein